MNRTGRPALALLPALTLCLFAGADFALAQAVIPEGVKTSPDVTASRATIQQAVDAAAKRLASDDPDDQAKGRTQLVEGAQLRAGGTADRPSAAYLDTYSQAAAKALMPLTDHPDMRVRLNAAIATARVAEKVNNLRLADVAIKFMNDKQPAVALWGVKAARAMIPAAVAAPGGKHPLLPAVIKTVQRNPLGPVVYDIYKALSLDIFERPANDRPKPAQIKAVLPHMLAVFRQRVNAYARGAVPADPSVDNLASDFLAFNPVWTQMTAQQQQQAVQSISDLLGYAGQYAELSTGDERQPLIPVFQRTGKALQLIGETLNLAGVVKAARDVQGVTTGMDGTEARNRADAVAQALQATGEFKAIKPAPQISLGGEPSASAGDEDTGEGGTGAKEGFDGKGPPGEGGAQKKAGPKPPPPRSPAARPAPAPATGQRPAAPPAGQNGTAPPQQPPSGGTNRNPPK